MLGMLGIGSEHRHLDGGCHAVLDEHTCARSMFGLSAPGCIIPYTEAAYLEGSRDW